MRARTIDTTHQLVADRRAALLATANRGRVRRLFARAGGQYSIDLTALEHGDAPAPAVIFRTRPVATPDAGRIHKVA